ncbi:MAG: hypothetical protein MK297_05745 [Planctomycetes bacterium]|nr:hypothetical protein [Planctomycetota bacterium]
MRDRRRFLLYGVAPLTLGLLFVSLYFSGVMSLQELVSPAEDREFGLIENVQNLILLSGALLCWRAKRLEADRGWRRLWALGVVACLVFFMEEIDWGDHYWSALTGAQRPAGEYFNLHNQGDINRWLKKVVDIGFVLIFFFLPLAKGRVREPLRPLLPKLHSALTLLGGAITSNLAHGLEDAGWTNNGSLYNNISEFRETFTYWVVVLYLWELSVLRRRASVGREELS